MDFLPGYGLTTIEAAPEPKNRIRRREPSKKNISIRSNHLEVADGITEDWHSSCYLDNEQENLDRR